MTLALDRDKIHDDLEEEPERPATIRWREGEGSMKELTIEVKVRGNYRRDPDHCNFPPLRLDFPSDSVVGTVFAGQDKIKIVTHCQNDKEEYEQFVLLEYLMYRTYNQLTDKSFRVRLADITYQDTRGEDEPMTRIGFFLEDNDLVAARHGCTIVEPQYVDPLFLAPNETALLGLFEYMMLNTDWSIVHRHNIETMSCNDGQSYAVPFDFDWAGIIRTPYAKPDPSLGIRSVRERLFRGYCREGNNEEFWRSAIAPFMEAKEDIYALYRTQERLEEKYRKRALEDIDKFYEILSDDRKFEREILRRCRQVTW